MFYFRSDPIDLMKINDFTSNKESIFEDIEHDVSFNNIFNMERQDILVCVKFDLFGHGREN